jgi:hypothetical protein
MGSLGRRIVLGGIVLDNGDGLVGGIDDQIQKLDAFIVVADVHGTDREPETVQRVAKIMSETLVPVSHIDRLTARRCYCHADFPLKI